MPSLADMLRLPPPRLETPQERDARMAEFHRRFPALWATHVEKQYPMAMRHSWPDYRSEADAYGEGIFDDD